LFLCRRQNLFHIFALGRFGIVDLLLQRVDLGVSVILNFVNILLLFFAQRQFPPVGRQCAAHLGVGSFVRLVIGGIAGRPWTAQTGQQESHGNELQLLHWCRLHGGLKRGELVVFPEVVRVSTKKSRT